MKPNGLSIAAGALLFVASSGIGFGQEPRTAVANFINGEGKPVGTGKISSLPASGVFIAVEVSELPAGKWVALHVHETGNCDHTGGHQSAGGHFNPTDKQHGFKSADGPHAGDLPNQYVGGDGILRAEIFSPTLTLDEAETGIFGRALIVHANPDDYESQPAGDAGDRLACAVIE
jgi:superoxide dismutase, Cu-Zn family